MAPMTDADYQGLVPVDVSREVVQKVMETSAVMRLARTIPMPTGVTDIPVLSAAPQAAFVSPRYGGRKPIEAISWTAERLVAEEIALTLPIPNAFIDDAGFPVWENVQPLVSDAIQRCFDHAALYGTSAPASYPAGGIFAFADPSPGTATTMPEGVSEAMSVTEAKGLMNTGILGGPALNSIFRTLSLTTRQLADVAAPTPTSLWGVPFATTVMWDQTKGDALTGDWSYVVVGVREDITVDLTQEGVLTDATGKVIVNAFQDDSTIMRAYFRVGLVVGKPLAVDGVTQINPLAVADSTVVVGTAASASSGKAAK